jgi:transposase
VKAQRQAWWRRLADVDLSRLVFLDESGAKTDLTRLYGRSFDGQRVVDRTPHGHWCTTTILSSVRLEGSRASMVVEAPTDTDVFSVYVQQVLLPQLRRGDIVVMDNLPPHKVAAVTELLEAAGVEVWYLPPYSPDFNPIEKMWSKIKAFLRKVEARTKEALWDAIGSALATVTVSDVLGWFTSCGYIQA